MANEFTGILQKITEVIRSDRNISMALSTVLAVHKPRIFQQGFDAKGVQIGTYSTKPASISKSKQARATGKTYFPGGVSEYKTAIGKNPGYVILDDTGQMKADYGLIGSGLSWGFGFQNDFNYQKSQWMERKYSKPIFDLSRNEENILADVLEKQILNALD